MTKTLKLLHTEILEDDGLDKTGWEKADHAMMGGATLVRDMEAGDMANYDFLADAMMDASDGDVIIAATDDVRGLGGKSFGWRVDTWKVEV